MKKLYNYLPIFLQDLAITIKNNHSYYQKYGAIPFIKPLKRIIKNNSAIVNDNGVVERINNIITEAVNNTDYYSKNKQYFPLLQTIEDIKNLPVLKKDIFKKENDSFISTKASNSNSYSFKTSGSTGTPLYGKISLQELRERFLVVLASQRDSGIDYSKRVARFLGANVANKRKVYRRDYINNHFLFSIYNISEDEIFKYYNAFKKYKIQIIEGYPSTIYSLVKLFKSKGLKINTVEHVMTTAEQLLDYQKQEIEEFFGCKVFDFYGSSEGSTYMYLTPEGNYLNANTVGFVEVVDEDYKPVKPGEFGRMLVTSFSSSFTPLIRYDIGDYCSIVNINNYVDEPLLIKEIGGRKEDVFITEEGKHFTRFSLCLKFLPDCIIESQLILTQRSKNVKVEFVATNSVVGALDFSAFEDKFQSMLGNGYTFSYERVREFNKSARGKLRAVVIRE